EINLTWANPENQDFQITGLAELQRTFDGATCQIHHFFSNFLSFHQPFGVAQPNISMIRIPNVKKNQLKVNKHLHNRDTPHASSLFTATAVERRLRVPQNMHTHNNGVVSVVHYYEDSTAESLYKQGLRVDMHAQH
ncbi:hypothetical protein ACJX0J_039603, partial [Zea mays]